VCVCLLNLVMENDRCRKMLESPLLSMKRFKVA